MQLALLLSYGNLRRSFNFWQKLHYDQCPCCQWSGNGDKLVLCQARRTWPVNQSYLFVTFSRERSQQELAKEGKNY